MSSNKTPEQREKANAYAREYRRNRTPEQREKDKIYFREYMRKWAGARRKVNPSTPEQRDEYNAYMRDWYQRQVTEDTDRKAKYYAKRKVWRVNNPAVMRAMGRRSKGLPKPTRPESDVCECCGGTNASGKAMSLDHDHETRAFRGWLCWPCNHALGMLGDNREGVLKLLAYLEKP